MFFERLCINDVENYSVLCVRSFGSMQKLAAADAPAAAGLFVLNVHWCGWTFFPYVLFVFLCQNVSESFARIAVKSRKNTTTTTTIAKNQAHIFNCGGSLIE